MRVINHATMKDLEEMDKLRKTEQNKVGFVPMSRWEWQVTYRSQTLSVMKEDGEMVGYIFWTPGLPVAAIQQLVIREDARRFERGSELVDQALEDMQDPQRYGVTCRCRLDLEANLFWEALGFEAVREESGGAGGYPLIRYYKELRPTLLPLGLYLPYNVRLKNQRDGFRFKGV